MVRPLRLNRLLLPLTLHSLLLYPPKKVRLLLKKLSPNRSKRPSLKSHKSLPRKKPKERQLKPLSMLKSNA